MGETTQAIAALRKAERLVDPERAAEVNTAGGVRQRWDVFNCAVVS
jgi:hypothetical protein